MDSPSQNNADKIFCTRCGHANPLWAVTCEKCFKKLNAADGVDLSRARVQRSRPGCITYYAGWLFFQSVISLLGVVVLLVIIARVPFAELTSEAPALQTMGPIAIVLFLGIALFSIGMNFLLGWGLWTLKNWARILVIILHVLQIMGTLLPLVVMVLYAVTGQPVNAPTLTLLSSVFSLVISGIFIYWFITNADYFH